MAEVSVKWTTDKNWQTKLRDTWRATQLNLLCEESVMISYSTGPILQSEISKHEVDQTSSLVIRAMMRKQK